MNQIKRETRGRKPFPGNENLTSAERTKRSIIRLIEAGGIQITSTCIKDPALSKKICDYAEKNTAGSKNEVARIALDYFFRHHDV